MKLGLEAMASRGTMILSPFIVPYLYEAMPRCNFRFKNPNCQEQVIPMFSADSLVFCTRILNHCHSEESCFSLETSCQNPVRCGPSSSLFIRLI